MNLSKLEARLKALESRRPRYERIVWLQPGESAPDDNPTLRASDSFHIGQDSKWQILM